MSNSDIMVTVPLYEYRGLLISKVEKEFQINDLVKQNEKLIHENRNLRNELEKARKKEEN